MFGIQYIKMRIELLKKIEKEIDFVYFALSFKLVT